MMVVLKVEMMVYSTVVRWAASMAEMRAVETVVKKDLKLVEM
jgi:hypothetical protein